MSLPSPLAKTLYAAVQASPQARPPLVVLHGVLASAATYTSLLRRPDCTPGSEKIAIDLAGHGRSPHDSSRLTYPTMAADVSKAIAEHPVVDLVGHSMGGKVAMTLALQQPDHVRRLVVVDIAVSSSANRIAVTFPNSPLGATPS